MWTGILLFAGAVSFARGQDVELHNKRIGAAFHDNDEPQAHKHDPKPKPTPRPGKDAEKDWTPTTTDFNTAGNWSPIGVPGSTDVAWFKVAESSSQNPNLSASVTIAGLYFQSTASSGYDITSSSTSIAFTLNGSASNDTGGETSSSTAAAIGANNTSGTNTIDAPIVLSPGAGQSSTIFQAGGGTLVINGAISGSSSNPSSLNKTGDGTLVLSGTNTFPSSLNIIAGTISVPTINNAGSNGPLGTSNTIVLGGTTGNTIGTLEYTGATTSTTRSFNVANGGTGAFQIDTAGTTLTISGTIFNSSGVGNVSKSGLGTLTLTGTSTYSGTTTVSAGTLKIDNNNAATPRLASTSGITLNSGGTLLLAQGQQNQSSDRINNSATVTMNGGTFNTGGFSEGTTAAAGLGALTLQANSIIDLGAGASILHFANSSAAVWTAGQILQIDNWSGSTSGGGTDQLIFGTTSSGLTASQLAEIQFLDPNGFAAGTYGATILSNGEVVPTPVPEPATWLAGSLVAVALVAMQLRKLARYVR